MSLRAASGFVLVFVHKRSQKLGQMKCRKRRIKIHKCAMVKTHITWLAAIAAKCVTLHGPPVAHNCGSYQHLTFRTSSSNIAIVSYKSCASRVREVHFRSSRLQIAGQNATSI